MVTYLVEIQNDAHTAKEIFLLKPKTTTSHLIDADFPIATLMYYDNSAAFHKEHKTLSYSSLKPIEEVYIKT